MKDHIIKGEMSIEREVKFLKAINELIDSIVNTAVLEIYGDLYDATVVCRSSTHQKFFGIILLDFISNTRQESPVGVCPTYPDALRSIIENPHFDDEEESITLLRDSTYKFWDWLYNGESILEKIYLKTISRDVRINIAPNELIYIYGNISKHSFPRLTGVVNKLKSLLTIDEKLSKNYYLILDDFYERFDEDIFNYYVGTIAEYLNNIRWGIHRYLLSEYQRSYEWSNRDSLQYNYSTPEGIDDEFAKACYWNLMNQIRRKPILQQFRVTDSLKKKY